MLLEKMLWLADFRQWPWWYYLAIPILFFFSLRWHFIFREQFENEPGDWNKVEGMCFVRLTGTISILMVLFVVFHRLGWLRFFYRSLYNWFGFGSFTFAALFAFVFVLSALILLVALTWQWIQSWEK